MPLVRFEDSSHSSVFDFLGTGVGGSGGYSIFQNGGGYIEWLVNVSVGQVVDLVSRLRLENGSYDSSFRIEVNGVSLGSTVLLASVSNFADYVYSGVSLVSGDNYIRLIHDGGFNALFVDYLDVDLAVVPPSPVPPSPVPPSCVPITFGQISDLPLGSCIGVSVVGVDDFELCGGFSRFVTLAVSGSSPITSVWRLNGVVFVPDSYLGHSIDRVGLYEVTLSNCGSSVVTSFEVTSGSCVLSPTLERYNCKRFNLTSGRLTGTASYDGYVVAYNSSGKIVGCGFIDGGIWSAFVGLDVSYVRGISKVGVASVPLIDLVQDCENWNRFVKEVRLSCLGFNNTPISSGIVVMVDSLGVEVATGIIENGVGIIHCDFDLVGDYSFVSIKI